MLVAEEHLDGGCDVLRTTVVDRCEDPRRFGEHEMRNPGPACDEGLSRSNLSGVIPCDKPDENVRVNGSHGAS